MIWKNKSVTFCRIALTINKHTGFVEVCSSEDAVYSESVDFSFGRPVNNNVVNGYNGASLRIQYVSALNRPLQAGTGDWYGMVCGAYVLQWRQEQDKNEINQELY